MAITQSACLLDNQRARVPQGLANGTMSATQQVEMATRRPNRAAPYRMRPHELLHIPGSSGLITIGYPIVVTPRISCAGRTANDGT